MLALASLLLLGGVLGSKALLFGSKPLLLGGILLRELLGFGCLDFLKLLSLDLINLILLLFLGGNASGLLRILQLVIV